MSCPFKLSKNVLSANSLRACMISLLAHAWSIPTVAPLGTVEQSPTRQNLTCEIGL